MGPHDRLRGTGLPPASRRTKVLPIAIALSLGLGACGSREDRPTVAAGQAPPDTVMPLEALEGEQVEVGTSVESEPVPRGTLIVGPDPADVFWVQALSDDGAADFANTATETTPLGHLRRPAEGMTQLLISRDGAHRLIGGRAGADPAIVADAAFALENLPTGWRFAEASAATTAALAPDYEDLPEGAVAVDLEGPSTGPIRVVVAPGSADSLAGLLGNLVIDTNVYSGLTEPGDEVVLIDDPADGQVLIVRAEHPASDIRASGAEILRATSDAIGS